MLWDGQQQIEAVTNQGIYESFDRGNSWYPVVPQVPSSGLNSRLVLRGSFYVATDNGVFRTPDSWASFSEGLPAGTSMSQVVSNSTGRFLCALPASGKGTYVYRYGLPKITLVPSSATLLVGDPVSLRLHVIPEQPESVNLTVESSDTEVLSPYEYTLSSHFRTRRLLRSRSCELPTESSI
jgi:hypothetical protein